MKVSEILLDLFDLALTGVAGATRRIAFMQKPTPEGAPNASITEAMWSRLQAGKTYLRGLFRLTLICLLFPIPILVLALFTNWGWLTAIVGMFWTLCSLVLLLLASPLGLIMEFVLGGIKGIGERYLKFSLGVFLVELLFTLYALIVPVQNNPASIPIVIIASAILGVIVARGVKTPFTQGFVAFVVTLVFIAFTFSFFFPQTFQSLIEWGGKLDAKLSKIVENPRSLLKDLNSPSRETNKPQSIKKSSANRQSVAQPGSNVTTKASGSVADRTPVSSIRVRKIEGAAYSYSRDAMAGVDPLFGTFEGNGLYPKAYLVFSSGLVVGHGAIKWNGSYTLREDEISLVVSRLEVNDPALLPEFYSDIGVGFKVQLEGAVFDDYTMLKTLIVFRTFAGDTPPARIEKSFPIMKVKHSQEQPYTMAGEWTGTYDARDKRENIITTKFAGRFVQSGNRFEGVILDLGPLQANTSNPRRARCQVEGLIVDGRVTFLKRYQGKQTDIISCVGSYLSGSSLLEGSWFSNMRSGRWTMTRRGDFVGTPNDMTAAEFSNLQ